MSISTQRVRPGIWLLSFAVLALGCTSTGALREHASDPKIRTVASIGDQPLNTVVGEPSSSRVADLGTFDPRRDTKGRVAGRVVDDVGEPVSNVRVRIADGGLSGGRVIESKTDRAGGFTLNGLRHGSSYELIAEYEGQGGEQVTGRTSVRSPESGVEIALRLDGTASDHRRADRSIRSRKVSERQPIDADEDDRPLRLNKEDLPKSSEVEDIDDLATRASDAKPKRAGGVPVSGTGWRKAHAGLMEVKGSIAASPAIVDSSARRVSVRSILVDESDIDTVPRPRKPRKIDPPDDDGENPLPPAIDPDVSPAAKGVPARIPEEPAEGPTPSRRTSQVNPKGPGHPPGALALAKEIPRIEEAKPEPVRVATKEKELELNPFATAPSAAKSRSTWGDMADVWSQESGKGRSIPTNQKLGPPPRFLMTGAEVDRSPAPPPPREAPRRPADREAAEDCRYDAQRHQLVDFRLPDVDGRSITLKDFDSEFILLDFWGTWCRPCLNSVPHLVELQKRLGGKSLSVVGIACEDGPASASSAHVDDVAERLGINYKVLVSTKDGASPIQEALHIQAYPTMVLLNRQGRIIWRETGATTANLAKLDHVLESSTRALAKAGDATQR